MGTITVNITGDTEKLFREAVRKSLGTGKGKLGSAIDDAMKSWAKEKEQEKMREEALGLLRKGFDMGGVTYKKRGELYDR